MHTSFQFADLLRQLMLRPRHRYTPGLVSKLSGVPKATIVNWLDGQVKRPRRWQDLVKVADVLRLSAADTTWLLQAAGYPSVEALLARAEHAEDRALLSAWDTADHPASRTPPKADHGRLPAPTDSFVGRAQELATLQGLLWRDDVRLITLTGPGGSGKTRLALHLSEREAGAFADGVCFVSLAPIHEPTLVATTIAQALGVSEIASRLPIERLKQELRDKHMLLLLDNFEQVAATAPLVAELLAAAPRVKVLITSRVVLRLAGEHVFRVPPLALPDWARPGQRPPLFETDCLAKLANCPAVTLFAQRAQAANPAWALTRGNVLAVAAICVRLDGLPLAIELAAAHSRVLDPFALLARLDGTPHGTLLQLLTRGPRDRPARQQTIRDTLAWGYDLLDPGAQRLFRWLAVFAGGCDLAAATEVLSDEGRGLNMSSDSPVLVTQSSVLDGLATLVDHSLLIAQADASGGLRFVMLETICEYALERLEASGELDMTRRRHATYYLALAEAAEPELQGPRQVEWLARLEADYDNLRAALGWLAETDPATGLRMVNALHEFWKLHSHFVEGHTWFARMLAQVPEPTMLRATALGRAGMLAYKQGNYATTHALHTESLSIRRALGDRPGAAASLNVLGHVATHQGDYALARALFEEGRAIWRELGDQRGIAVSYEGLGRMLALQGDNKAALTHYSECLALMRTLGNKQDIAIALNNLGNMLRSCGEYVQAALLYDESLPLFRELGDREGIAWHQHNLGQLAHAQGDDTLAAAHFKESLALCSELGSRAGIAYGIAGLGAVALARGRLERAARLFGAVDALLDTIGGRMNATDRAIHSQNVASVRDLLGAPAFEAAWAQGQSLTIEQAVVDAFDEHGCNIQPQSWTIAYPATDPR